jgi:hypothetical protein
MNEMGDAVGDCVLGNAIGKGTTHSILRIGDIESAQTSRAGWGTTTNRKPALLILYLYIVYYCAVFELTAM